MYSAGDSGRWLKRSAIGTNARSCPPRASCSRIERDSTTARAHSGGGDSMELLFPTRYNGSGSSVAPTIEARERQRARRGRPGVARRCIAAIPDGATAAACDCSLQDADAGCTALRLADGHLVLQFIDQAARPQEGGRELINAR
eukprot:scaffold3161_cov118-Isochrysis_galbana.AAC.16